MDGREMIKPLPTAKLGLTFSRYLRWKEHIRQAIKGATKVTIAPAWPRHPRPEKMRQLYQACVTPVVDYACTVWHDPLCDKSHLRHIRQRAAMQSCPNADTLHRHV